MNEEFSEKTKISYPLIRIWTFTIDSSLLLDEGVQFFFHDMCHFSVAIADCVKGLYKSSIKY